MKKLISKLTGPVHVKNAAFRIPLFNLTFIFFLMSFFFSCSAFSSEQSSIKNVDSNSKKQDLLQKLEQGNAISSEDIRSSFRNSVIGHQEFEDVEFEVMPVPPDHAERFIPGPFIYHNHHGREHIIISESDMNELHKRLSESVVELKRNIDNFRNSEEFSNMQEELKKWNDSFKKELKKMKEELIKSQKESHVKSSSQNIL
jgi:hypothetical protein